MLLFDLYERWKKEHRIVWHWSIFVLKIVKFDNSDQFWISFFKIDGVEKYLWIKQSKLSRLVVKRLAEQAILNTEKCHLW